MFMIDFPGGVRKGAMPLEKIKQLRDEALARPLARAGEMFSHLTSERLLLLLGCLVDSNKFAHKFNEDKELRTALWKAGFLRKKNRSKPNLLKQEKNSLECSLKIMFRIYEAKDRSDSHEAMQAQILEVTTSILNRYSGIHKIQEQRTLVCSENLSNVWLKG